LFLPANAITGNNVMTAILGRTPKLAYGHSSGIVDAVYDVRPPDVAPESQNLLPQVAECPIVSLKARLIPGEPSPATPPEASKNCRLFIELR
jgi:hypothetical protein